MWRKGWIKKDRVREDSEESVRVGKGAGRSRAHTLWEVDGVYVQTGGGVSYCGGKKKDADKGELLP